MATPRVKNPKNVTARELAGYDDTLVPPDGGEPPAPQGPPDPPAVDLAFYARQGWSRRFVAMGSADTDYFGAHRPRYPVGTQNVVRLVVGVRDAGAAGAYAKLLYSETGAPGTWANPGVSGTPVTVSLATASDEGDIVGFGYPLAALPNGGDVWFKCVLGGGDGVASPALGRLSAQFYHAQQPARERLYWRDGDAVMVPTLDALIIDGGVTTPQGLGSGCSPCPPGAAATFLTTSPADPLGAPKRLLHAKQNSTNAVLAGNTDAGHTDWIGHVGRFVSAGLVGGQTVPEFLYTVGGAGQLVSADPDGGGIGYGLGVYRPSTAEWIHFGTRNGFQPGFRFSPRGRVYQIPMASFVTEDDDRFVLDVALSIKVGCGCAESAHDLPAWALYGGSYDGFVNDEDLSGQTIASYVEVPKLRYLDEVP